MSYKSEHGVASKFANRDTSASGITSEEEKNHVIRVLEHESKVFRLEKKLLGFREDGDYYSEHGNEQRHCNV